MSERDELVSRLREGTFGTDLAKTDVYLNALTAKAADQIERLTAENQRLREALEWYADQMCEMGARWGGCGNLTDDQCAGCRAYAALQNTEASHDD